MPTRLSLLNLGEIKENSHGLSEATPMETLLHMTFDPEGIADRNGLNAFCPEVLDIWHPSRMLMIHLFDIRWCRRFAPLPPANIFQAFSLIWPTLDT